MFSKRHEDTVRINKFQPSLSIMEDGDGCLFVMCLPNKDYVKAVKTALSSTLGFGYWYNPLEIGYGNIPAILAKSREIIMCANCVDLQDVIDALNLIAARLSPLEKLSYLTRLDCLCDESNLPPPPPEEPPIEQWDNPPPVYNNNPVAIDNEFCDRMVWAVESLKLFYRTVLEEWLASSEWEDWEDYLSLVYTLLPPPYDACIVFSWEAFINLAELSFNILIPQLIEDMDATLEARRNALICGVISNEFLTSQQLYEYVDETLRTGTGLVESTAWFTFIQMIDWNVILSSTAPEQFLGSCSCTGAYVEMFAEFTTITTTTLPNDALEGSVTLPFTVGYTATHNTTGRPIVHLRIWTDSTKTVALPCSLNIGTGETNADKIRVWVNQVAQPLENLVLPFSETQVTEVRLEAVPVNINASLVFG